MTDETQFKHNARGNMDLNKKRDELNTYIADYGHAEVFNRGFDAAVEILSEEIKELDRLFRLAREQRNEAEDKVKELEKALENLLERYSQHDYGEVYEAEARQTLSKLRGGK